MAFRVIPVIDLRGGLVVRARAGDRDGYAPIVTPLARGSAPADVARGMLDAYQAETLYVADLDAIVEGRAPDAASLRDIAAACPGVDLWVDAGFRDARGVRGLPEDGLCRPVIGSESLDDTMPLRAFCDTVVLSLDTKAGTTLGPPELHADATLWPRDVIVMTLSRVGSGDGPDFSAVANAVSRRPDVRVYAAGGVRGQEDLDALARIGAAGALVASIIHDGRLEPRPTHQER